ncbi:MAG: hypothetical protein IPJ65_34755 [Archangiaceae bacterium]|nr:hypothetical protein [Archangiaceae bacterium]
MTFRRATLWGLMLAAMACGGNGTGGVGGGSGGSGGAGGSGGGAGSGASCDAGSGRYTVMGSVTRDGTFTGCRSALPTHSGSIIRVAFGDFEQTSTTFELRGVELLFPSALGTYHCDGGTEVMMSFLETHTALDGGSYRQAQFTSNSPGVMSCTLTLTTLETTSGGAVRGTFSAVLPPSTGTPSKPDASVTLTDGTFDSTY